MITDNGEENNNKNGHQFLVNKKNYEINQPIDPEMIEVRFIISVISSLVILKMFIYF